MSLRFQTVLIVLAAACVAQAGGLPDLTVQSVYLDCYAYGPTRFDITFCNGAPDAVVQPFQVGLFASPDLDITTDDYLLATLEEGYLAGSDCTNRYDVEVAYPPPTGYYYVGVIVDYYGQVSEENEGNNTGIASGIALLGASPVDAVALPAEICSGEHTQLHVPSVPVGEVRWSEGADCNGNWLYGNDLQVGPMYSTTYGVQLYDPLTGCHTNGCAEVMVIVRPSPGAPGAYTQDDYICRGDAAVLESYGDSVSVDWYTGSCGDQFVGTGDFLLVWPEVTTTYYARSRYAATGCESFDCSQTIVHVGNVPPTPVAPIASTNLCGEKTLEINGEPPQDVNWFWQGTSCGTSDQYYATSPYTATVSGTYYLRARSNTSGPGCWSEECAAVTVDVHPYPDEPLAVHATPEVACIGEEVVLSAYPVPGVSIDWFEDYPFGTYVGTGNPLTVTPPEGGAVYYACTVDDASGCLGLECQDVYVSVEECSPLGDLDRDGDVDLQDFAIFMTAFGGPLP